MSSPLTAADQLGGRSLLLATTNPHKIAEFRDLLREAPYELIDPRDLGLDLDIPETGATFAENAEIKARAWARASQMLALADDSGLEIDALNGDPGLYSARWAGPDVTYPERFRILLAKLHDVPADERTARYRCAIAVADPAQVRFVVDGVLEGRIATAPRGSGGFGYDPIFDVPAFGRTVGEMTAAEKHRISHRARAAEAAVRELKRLASG